MKVNTAIVNRRPTRNKCMRCKADVATGVGQGIPYRVDMVPLTAQGELVAKLDKRDTFSVIYGQLRYRTVHEMKKKSRAMVWASHKCGAPLLEHFDMERIQELGRVAKAIFLTEREESDVAQEALVTIWDTLGGHVIEQDQLDFEPPPF